MRIKLIGIYCIKNIINCDEYIGSSIDLERRIANHKSALINKRHVNLHLQSSFNKYGKDAFKFKIIYIMETEVYSSHNLDYMEYRYIKYLIPIFNKRKISNTNRGYKHTNEAKNKISKAHLGTKRSHAVCKYISERSVGKKISLQCRNKISNTLIDRHGKGGR